MTNQALRGAPSASLGRYRELMERFVHGEIAAIDFERRFLDLFKKDDTFRPPETFAVLNALFFDVDAFCADPELRNADDLDEEQLRARVKAALHALS